MKWYAIAGGWRRTDLVIELRIREEVRKILFAGNAIVSGGALGVDQIATDEALLCGAGKTQLKIIIPSSLEVYCEHYRKRAEEGIVSSRQATTLIEQLTTVKAIGALVEGTYDVLTKEAYFGRITQIVACADALVAFHINHTEGTQDTIDKARRKGIPVSIFSYELE